MSERLRNIEISNLLNAEGPKMDPRLKELITDLYKRVLDLEDQVKELNGG